MGNAEPTVPAGHHCPKCDYDLRGLTESRCPECGSAFSTPQIAAYKDQRWPPERFFRWLLLATILWGIAYVFVDVIHETRNRVKSFWVTIPLLVAIPLQVFIAIVARQNLEASSTRSKKRSGAALVVILWILILGHIAITVGTL